MSSTLKLGSKGPEVVNLQKSLVSFGYGVSVDGAFGRGTESAVKSFQESQGLSADGVVGSATWAALDAKPALGPVDWYLSIPLLKKMLNQQYQLSKAQCPSQPLGVSVKRIGEETTNCVLFSAWFLCHMFDRPFTSGQWSQWMVSSGEDNYHVPAYGPRVCIDWGVATTAPSKGPWLVQYFTDSGGHSMIVLCHDAETDKILTLESNSAFKLNGCGWGDIGNLRSVFNPGPSWKDKVTQTWASRISSKRAVHVVSLDISSESINSWLQEGVV